MTTIDYVPYLSPATTESDIKPRSSTALKWPKVRGRSISNLEKATAQDYAWSVNSTATKAYPVGLEDQFIEILALGRNEIFE
jgi:hypothetical protein